MAAPFSSAPNDGRSYTSSPRPKARDSAKSTLCRNITIYGYCRHENDGCMYNHPKARQSSGLHSQAESIKKRFNVESPAFTPNVTENGSAQKTLGLSPRVANATPFTPKAAKAGLATPSPASRHQSSEWSNHDFQEFVPQSFNHAQVGDPTSNMHMMDSINPYDGTTSYTELESTPPNQNFNVYGHDAGAGGGPTLYAQHDAFAQPLNYHLYAPTGPHRENLLAYQRTAHDFFISENLRQDLQRKAETTLQTLPNTNLPPNVEHFHSLVPLDIATQKSTTAFGYNSWLYKAQSSKDGYYYALRRLEGFRLTSEKSIRTIQAWKRIASASCVTIHDCFTTRAFGDSSLVFVTDYHPNSKTLLETHYPAYNGSHRALRTGASALVPEHIIWGYLVQLTSALKSVHANNLTARIITPSKILVTGKNRIRLNGNAILDVVQPPPDNHLVLSLHQEDFRQLGRLALALATGNSNPSNYASSPATTKALDTLTRTYSERFKATILSLLDSGNNSNPTAIHTAATLSSSVADHALSSLDAALHESDTLSSTLTNELENGRLVRLLVKLHQVTERPEYSPHDPSSASVPANTGVAGPYTQQQAALNRGAWSETGERYYLKLVRDYVFHQVSGETGRPVLDLAHVVTCLNKLDAGTEEKIALATRDEQNVIVISWREVKRGLEVAWGELRSAEAGVGVGGIGSGIGGVGARGFGGGMGGMRR